MRTRTISLLASTVVSSLLFAACAPSVRVTNAPAATAGLSTTPPTPDPRVGLRPGVYDAGEAIWNLRLVSTTPPSPPFVGADNTDLAFQGKYAIQGNYNGFQIWDISNPSKPALVKSYLCPASQSDVSIYGNLLFVSGEGLSGRLDCGTQGVRDTVSAERLRGIRIFDVSDMANPTYVANVQTCRGSHTHTVVSDPNDKANVYVYVSGASTVRSPNELPGCLDAPITDPNTSRFRIEVIKVPLAAPQQARIVSSPRIFNDLPAPPTPAASRDTAAGGRGGRAGGAPRPGTGPEQCHDITVYPAIGRAGGACRGYGLLLDIRDPANPVRIGAVADSNFSFWHSATFNNDGTKVLFTDEWGGGRQPRCRPTDKYEWGANAIFTVAGNTMTFRSYYKMPAAQTATENCVAHNGSLIPIPGRDVMVQGWYQGGISIFDWTDASNPKEIAYFDRGPMYADRLVTGGSWSVYWYNGLLVNSEILRGLDILELVPSGFLSQNEIDAAKTVRFDQLNAQEQPRLVWPPSFALARAYVDQLERSRGLPPARLTAIRAELTRAERLPAAERAGALTRLGAALSGDAAGSPDAAKVRMLADAVRDLAAVR